MIFQCLTAAAGKTNNHRRQTRQRAARSRKTDMKLKLIFLVPAFFCLTAVMAAQTKNESDYTMVENANGIVINYTNAAQPFGLTITGKNAAAARDEEGAVSIQSGGGLVTIRFFKTEDFIDLSKNISGAEILESHRDWRTWMQAAEMNGRVRIVEGKPESLTISDSSAGAATLKIVVPALSWSSGRQGENERVFYRTALLGNVVVMIGSPADSEEKLDRARAITAQTLESLRLLPAAPQSKKNPAVQKRKSVRRKSKR